MTGMSCTRGMFTVGKEKLFREALVPFSPVMVKRSSTVKPEAKVLMAVPQIVASAFRFRWK